jgi:hypothetical protein
MFTAEMGQYTVGMLLRPRTRHRQLQGLGRRLRWGKRRVSEFGVISEQD